MALGAYPSRTGAGNIHHAAQEGPLDDMANYPAICLLCHSYKLLSAVVARRLMAVLEDRLPDTQAGFRPARGCVWPQMVHQHGPPGRQTSCRHRHRLQCCVWHREPVIPRQCPSGNRDQLESSAHCPGQRPANPGPRAKFGPRSSFNWPAWACFQH